MKSSLWYATLIVSLLTFTLLAGARDVVLPAGTLLQCTLNEPNFSSATADVGDPVLCHLHSVVEFGQQAFPRGSYLVGHLAAEKEPGHFVGKGYLQLQFDRIGLPTGDLPIETKIIATSGYKVDREGKIDGKGHAKRDVAEWLFPPLWPWKVIMLPARGPRPTLKGESAITLRLMDDVLIPELARANGPGWQFFGQVQNQSFRVQGSVQSNARANDNDDELQSAARDVSSAQLTSITPQVSYATYVSREDDSASVVGVEAAPGMPLFVLNTGIVLAVSGYGYQGNRITYTLVAGGGGVITANEVDWNTTIRLNNQRGVHLMLHAARAPTGTPGF